MFSCDIFANFSGNLFWHFYGNFMAILFGNIFAMFLLDLFWNIETVFLWHLEAMFFGNLEKSVILNSHSIKLILKIIHLFRHIMTMFVRFFVTLFVISIPMALFSVRCITLLLINCFIIVFTLKKSNKNHDIMFAKSKELVLICTFSS